MMLDQKYAKIYELVKSIPLGKVMTYGQISKELSLNSPRLVGRALHQNPKPGEIPCHRVVNSQGKLAQNFAFGGSKVQMEILRQEGVEFIGERVNLANSHYIKFRPE